MRNSPIERDDKVPYRENCFLLFFYSILFVPRIYCWWFMNWGDIPYFSVGHVRLLLDSPILALHIPSGSTEPRLEDPTRSGPTPLEI